MIAGHFARVRTDWKYRNVDQLDGIDLKHGELLDIRFNDGTILPATVTLEEAEYDLEGKNGKKHVYRVAKGYFFHEIHGTVMLIPLSGMSAARK